MTTDIVTGKFYTFRHKSFNFNGESPYSDPFTTYACVLPSKPGAPTWITSTETTIEIKWTAPSDDGGCPIREYRIFRDTGAGLQDVVTSVHATQLANKSYVLSLVVSEFPASSLGKRFVFATHVYTDFAVAGISSNNSASMILAGLPGKPADSPTRESLTDEHNVDIAIVGIVQDNGAAINSLNIEIDNGLGGAFAEVQGQSSNSMQLKATVSTGIVSGRYYRTRYRAKNEVGFGPYSEISYILAASIPEQPTTIEAVINGDKITI